MNEVVSSVITEHSKSFSLASRLLAGDRRGDAVALYAWCRRADDAVDLSSEPHAAVARLRRELDAVYDGAPQSDPVLQAFNVVVTRRRLPRHYADELIAGMEMDLAPVLYPDDSALALYCYRVAGVVGLMMCHVLGVGDERALSAAARLGIAMQLTNIARDVGEDWERGRLYVPYRWLGLAGEARARALLRAPMPGWLRDRVPPAVRALASLADQYYRAGMAGIPALAWRSGLAVRTAALVYAGIHRSLAAQQWQPLRQRAHVGVGGKCRCLVRALCGQLLATRHAARRVQVPVEVLDFGPALLLPRQSGSPQSGVRTG